MEVEARSNQPGSLTKFQVEKDEPEELESC